MKQTGKGCPRTNQLVDSVDWMSCRKIAVLLTGTFETICEEHAIVHFLMAMVLEHGMPAPLILLQVNLRTFSGCQVGSAPP